LQPGVGRVYQQTFIDTYAKVACTKLYDRKMPITAADPPKGSRVGASKGLAATNFWHQSHLPYF
jgi:hypothetical protein